MTARACERKLKEDITYFNYFLHEKERIKMEFADRRADVYEARERRWLNNRIRLVSLLSMIMDSASVGIGL